MPSIAGWNSKARTTKADHLLERRGGGQRPGASEQGAHFYRSLQLDAHGNPINKRNAWATRATMYAHLIPPGAADTVHYRLKFPRIAGTDHADRQLNYRKFSWWNTQWAFAGVRDPADPHPDVAPDHDDGMAVSRQSLNGVSAKPEQIPDVPIVQLAERQSHPVPVLPRTRRHLRQNFVRKEEWRALE